MKQKKSDLLSFEGLTRQSILEMFAFARYMKEKMKHGEVYQPLVGKTLAMIFEKPSLRTRTSFEVGIDQLGGHAVHLSNEMIGLGVRESVHDVAKLLSRYNDAIVLRTFAQQTIEDLAREASVPVINALTDLLHPCQVLADAFTLYEKEILSDGMKLVFIGDGNNVANSWIEFAEIFPIEVVIACPAAYETNQAITERAKNTHAKISIEHDVVKASRDADVLYTDVWVSMGQEREAAEKVKKFREYQINDKLLSVANKDAVVMHCLPAHRGMEITDEAMDGEQSIIWDEAENRLHLQKAILVKLMSPAVYRDFQLTRRLHIAAGRHAEKKNFEVAM